MTEADSYHTMSPGLRITASSSPEWVRTNRGQSSSTSWPRFRIAEITCVSGLVSSIYIIFNKMFKRINKPVNVADEGGVVEVPPDPVDRGELQLHPSPVLGQGK